MKAFLIITLAAYLICLAWVPFGITITRRRARGMRRRHADRPAQLSGDIWGRD